jgi:heme/copper-type cytochrome/quinol oxidase subunit 2
MADIKTPGDLLIMMFFVAIPAIVFLFMLWAPTCFVVFKQKASRYPRNRIFAYALPLELLTAAILALLVQWAGLWNPAAYAFAITLTTGVLGAVAVHHLSKVPEQ